MVEFTLIGSGVQRPTPDRYLTSLALKVKGDRFLFDTPENIQTLLQVHGVRMNLDAIFLTDLGPSTTLGFPGLTLSLSSLARQMNADMKKFSLYVPEASGAKDRIRKLRDIVSDSCSIDIIYVSPGDIICENDDYYIKTFSTNRNEKGTSVGYRFQECERKGRFDREKAEALGIPPGPKFGQLHEGKAVELQDGRTIEPEQVVGPQRPGRGIVYTGATRFFTSIPDAIRDADILITDGGMTTDHPVADSNSNHMTAYQAGTIAGAAGADFLIVTHVRGVYGPTPTALRAELEDAFDGHTLVGCDGITAVLRPKETTDEYRDLDEMLAEFQGHPRAYK